jgi:hypothetical protein
MAVWVWLSVGLVVLWLYSSGCTWLYMVVLWLYSSGCTPLAVLLWLYILAIRLVEGI